MNFQEAVDLMDQGLQYKRMGNYQASLVSYLKAEQVLGNEPELYKSLGKVYYILGQYQKAIDCYAKAIGLMGELDIVMMKHLGQAICDPRAVTSKQKALVENYRGSIDPYFSKHAVKKYEFIPLVPNDIADYERHCINTAVAQFR